ncbi:hypothetical protein TNCV_1045391 [Trichonephila clavipes]|nr:hypothetical protein TNCV_1045391 [Trichonephila clavipes]
MFGTLPYDSPLPNQVKLNYPPIQQARQIAVNRTIKHHKINKQRYDRHYVDAKFKVGDLVLYQNFSYPNSRATSADEGERILGRTWLVSPRCDVVLVGDAQHHDEGERILGRTWLVSPRCDVVFGNARLRGKRSAMLDYI